MPILICDDDKYFFEILRDYLCKNMYFNKSDFLYSGNKEDMLKTYRKVKPDLVFMDIEVGENIGFDIIRELLKEGYSPQVVYITNYDYYVFDAFVGQPLGFVRKQSLETDLETVLREVNRVLEKRLKVIEITSGTTKYTLKLSEIIAFEIFVHDMTVYYYDDTELTVRYTLKKIENELNKYDFIKISRNTLINLNYIKDMSKDMIVMKNGRRLYISSRNVTEVKNGLSAYELAVKNGYKGTLQEWLLSLSGKSAYSSIVAIENGHVTGRKVGDGPSHVVLEQLGHEDDSAKDQLAYLTRTKDGKILKSSSVYIRDESGKVSGILGINYDISMMQLFENSLHDFISADQHASREPERITLNVADLLDDLIRQADELVGKPVALMTKDDKVKAIRYLSNSGALLITKSGDKIAKHFGISKYTLYSYLDNSKTGGTNEL